MIGSPRSTNVSKFYTKWMIERDAGKGKVLQDKEDIRASKIGKRGDSSQIKNKRTKDPTPQKRTFRVKKEKKLKID